MIKKRSSAPCQMFSMEQITSELDGRYVRKGFCEENTRAINDKVDTLRGDLDVIGAKLDRMTWIFAVIGVAVLCIAVKVVFG